MKVKINKNVVHGGSVLVAGCILEVGDRFKKEEAEAIIKKGFAEEHKESPVAPAGNPPPKK